MLCSTGSLFVVEVRVLDIGGRLVDLRWRRDAAGVGEREHSIDGRGGLVCSINGEDLGLRIFAS